MGNKIGTKHTCKPKIISYVITWDGISLQRHNSYAKEIDLTTKIEFFIQIIVFKKTVESVSFSYKRDDKQNVQIR